MKKNTVLLFALIVISTSTFGRSPADTCKVRSWNLHYQNTIVLQRHPAFHSPYEGANSLISTKESTTSITGTLFTGLRLWKGASVYLDGELSGGSGFSATKGVASFPNGEVYRVDDPSPHIGLARLYFTQVFALGKESELVEDAAHQLGGMRPSSYIAVTVGKFSIMDFFDNNQYSHDPRTQFYNWGLMGNGAWDYPADTKGYTQGAVIEYKKSNWSLRFAAVMVPNTANGPVFDSDLSRSRSEALEIENRYRIGQKQGCIRFLAYLTEAQMGSYQKAIDWGTANQSIPMLDKVNAYGRTKYGIGINIEQEINDYAGAFLRASWNDGKNESWAFTEIDRALSIGGSFDGKLWHRKEDRLGLAFLVNGISKDHQNYLSKGGYGFIIGDGQLNYSPEIVTEAYYSFKVNGYPFWLSPDYQFIANPGYNMDRGAVNSIGLRVHAEF